MKLPLDMVEVAKSIRTRKDASTALGEITSNGSSFLESGFICLIS